MPSLRYFCLGLLLLATTLSVVGHGQGSYAQDAADAPASADAAADAAAEPAADEAAAEPVADEAAPAEEPAVSKTADEVSADLGMKLDTVWVMLAACLVMWMQAGFALVEVGLTRAKNAVNICMKNLLDYCFGSVAYWIIGFGLMYSVGSGALENYVGDSGFFMSETIATDGSSNFSPLSWATVPLEVKFFFQLVFAATAATIVSGAMAERTKFASYMAYSIIISAVIYPISGHWIWGGGWLADMGFWDFAGSTVVHSVGGWLSLVGAFVLGPRIGKFDASGKPRAIPGHNIVLVVLGVFILWLGWFGFNPGSTMSMMADPGLVGKITLTTNAGGAMGAITAMVTARLLFGKWEGTMALNGALAGLVSVTCPCAWISVPSAFLIGGIGGILVVFSVLGIEKFLKIDDPVGAISVHGVCGAWGTLALGLFSNGTGEASPLPGLFTGGDATQLINQAIGVGAVFAWCMVTGAICFYGIKFTMGLRVTAAEESEGLDAGEHGNEAYHGFQLVTDSTGV